MLLRNYYNQLVSHFTNTDIENGLKTPSGTLKLCSHPGSSSTNGVHRFFHKINGVTNGDSHSNICVGSGTTPPTFDDYKLEKQIKTSLTGSVNVKQMVDDGYVIEVSVTNGHTDTITINEVGIISFCLETDQYGTSGLIERTVLPEPLELTPGESGVISYKIRIAPEFGAFAS